MPIATDVAGVEGWRIGETGRAGNPHDIPFPTSRETQTRIGIGRGRCVYVRVVELVPKKTELEALLENTAAYAQEMRKRILVDFATSKVAKKNRTVAKKRKSESYDLETDTQCFDRVRDLREKRLTEASK